MSVAGFVESFGPKDKDHLAVVQTMAIKLFAVGIRILGDPEHQCGMLRVVAVAKREPDRIGRAAANVAARELCVVKRQRELGQHFVVEHNCRKAVEASPSRARVARQRAQRSERHG